MKRLRNKKKKKSTGGVLALSSCQLDKETSSIKLDSNVVMNRNSVLAIVFGLLRTRPSEFLMRILDMNFFLFI